MKEQAREILTRTPFDVETFTIRLGNPMDTDWEPCSVAVKLVETFNPTRGWAIARYKGEPILSFYTPGEYLGVDLYSTEGYPLDVKDVHPKYLEAVGIAVKEVQYA